PSLSIHPPASTELYTLSLHDALPISATNSGSPTSCSSCGCAPIHSWPGLSMTGSARCTARPPHARRTSTAASPPRTPPRRHARRSEEHTSELQSPYDLVCRLLLEKNK